MCARTPMYLVRGCCTKRAQLGDMFHPFPTADTLLLSSKPIVLFLSLCVAPEVFLFVIGPTLYLFSLPPRLISAHISGFLIGGSTNSAMAAAGGKGVFLPNAMGFAVTSALAYFSTASAGLRLRPRFVMPRAVLHKLSRI